MILLTTPMPYPDQALAAANVAIASAQNGTSTVLIDANLRAPQLHLSFGVSAPTGLNELLLTQQNATPQASGAALCATDVPDLRLLCAGEKLAAPRELQRLFSTRLSSVLTNLRTWLQEQEQQASLIIINGPPVLTGVEASLLATLASQTFLVIATGRTTRTQAQRAQEQLQQAHAQLAGSILLNI